MEHELRTPGAPVGLVVTSPFSGTSAVVHGIDSETLPNPIPVGNVSTFTLAVSGGARTHHR